MLHWRTGCHISSQTIDELLDIISPGSANRGFRQDDQQTTVEKYWWGLMNLLGFCASVVGIIQSFQLKLFTSTSQTTDCPNDLFPLKRKLQMCFFRDRVWRWFHCTVYIAPWQRFALILNNILPRVCIIYTGGSADMEINLTQLPPNTKHQVSGQVCWTCWYKLPQQIPVSVGSGLRSCTVLMHPHVTVFNICRSQNIQHIIISYRTIIILYGYQWFTVCDTQGKSCLRELSSRPQMLLLLEPQVSITLLIKWSTDYSSD